MKKLIASPARVYIIMALLAALGLWASLKLPVSLFPNTAQPEIGVWIPYGSYSSEEFRRVYGNRLEGELAAIRIGDVEVEKQEGFYSPSSFFTLLRFPWGTDGTQALRETQQAVTTISSTLPEDVRRQVGVWQNGGDSFFGMTFYSKKRSLSELHKILEPLLVPPMNRVKDTNQIGLYNPNEREIRVELRPQILTAIGLAPSAVEYAIQRALGTQNGGNLKGDEGGQLPIILSRSVSSLDDLRHVMISLPGDRNMPLGDIADLKYAAGGNHWESFATSGVPSLILFAKPKQGGNVKRMAEEILAIVEQVKPSFPDDVEYRVMVDPSSYIRSAISNVMFEVALGSLLASLVLFLFIGSLRNVITTAIEIPISIALAFLMMKIFGININLLSLAGLALAAGMNVDASVVVMENIFRHFEEAKGPMNYKDKLDSIVRAVDEVKTSVIASTLASLVVFIPFLFISGLSFAILGDLVQAVIFSHGFSAVVALILVPTVRLHLMRGENRVHEKAAPIDFIYDRFEKVYLKSLNSFIHKPWALPALIGSVAAVIAALVLFALPRLPREIIGKPETDWITVNVNTQSNTDVRQMEATIAKLDHDISALIGDQVQYTFDEVHGPSNGNVLARIKDKGEMKKLKEKLEKAFPNAGGSRITVDEWNPSEFQIPDPPHIRVAISGGEPEDRLVAARDLQQLLEGTKSYARTWTRPDVTRNATLKILPKREQWNLLEQNGFGWSTDRLTDALRVATEGKWVGELLMDGVRTPVTINYPEGHLSSIDDLASFPLNVKGELIPLRAIATIEHETTLQNAFVEDGREMAVVFGKLSDENKKNVSASLKKHHEIVNAWIRDRLPTLGLRPLAVQIEDPAKELSESLNQLTIAFAGSIALIFLTIVLQFGSIGEALLVLAAVPLGLLGAIASLFVFGSSLSVNAVLGMILLNGIAVNNSIILVDFARRLLAQGIDPFEACLQSAKQRLRPILITSLTTILGMTPIALGFGTGGRVLQPLGIAVAGGLGVSMLLTLIIVPALQVRWMLWAESRASGQPLLVEG